MGVNLSEPPKSHGDLITKLLAQSGFDPFDNPAGIAEIGNAIKRMNLAEVILVDGISRVYIPDKIAEAYNECKPHLARSDYSLIKASIENLIEREPSEDKDYAIAYLRNVLDCITF